MHRNDTIERLVADLRPVRVRNWRVDGLLLACVCVAELLAFLALGLARPDFAAALAVPMFWWKCVASWLLAFVGFVVAIRAISPTHSPSAGTRILSVLAFAAVIAGLVLVQIGDLRFDWLAVRWPEGAKCLVSMMIFSLPAAACLGVLLRRGAPTDLAGTSWVAGFAAASWGALVYTFECRHDEAAFVLIWYAVGIVAIASAVRVLLPSLIRW